MCCVCPLPSGKVFDMCCSHLTSHFAVPKGTAVWLATIVWCLTASSLLTASYLMHLAWCRWHHSFDIGHSQCYSLLPFPSVVGHYKCPCSTHADFKFGWTKICQIIFEFWPQIKGICANERVTRSKKRHFLKFFVMYWMTNGYTNIHL